MRPMFQMGVAEALWDEHLDGVIEQLVAVVAEHLFDLPVDEDDATVATRDYDGVRSPNLKKPVEAGVSLLCSWTVRSMMRCSSSTFN